MVASDPMPLPEKKPVIVFSPRLHTDPILATLRATVYKERKQAKEVVNEKYTLVMTLL